MIVLEYYKIPMVTKPSTDAWTNKLSFAFP
jgi:hypothetical protein